MRVTPPFHPRNIASIMYCVVYYLPRTATAQLLINHVIDTPDVLRVRFPAAELVICGDLNRLDVSDILHQLYLTQIVDFPPHDQTTLDLIITDLSQQYSLPQSLPPRGTQQSSYDSVGPSTHHFSTKVSCHQDLQAHTRLCHEWVRAVTGAISMDRGDCCRRRQHHVAQLHKHDHRSLPPLLLRQELPTHLMPRG